MGPGNRTGGPPQPTGRHPNTPKPSNDDPDNLRSRAKDKTPISENPASKTSKRSSEQGSQSERASGHVRESRNPDAYVPETDGGLARRERAPVEGEATSTRAYCDFKEEAVWVSAKRRAMSASANRKSEHTTGADNIARLLESEKYAGKCER